MFEFCKQCPYYLELEKKKDIKKIKELEKKQDFLKPIRLSKFKTKQPIFILWEKEAEYKLFIEKYGIENTHYSYIPISSCMIKQIEALKYCYNNHPSYKKLIDYFQKENKFYFITVGAVSFYKSQLKLFLLEIFKKDKNISSKKIDSIIDLLNDNSFTIFKLKGEETDKEVYLTRIYNFKGIKTNFLIKTQTQLIIDKLHYVINKSNEVEEIFDWKEIEVKEKEKKVSKKKKTTKTKKKKEKENTTISFNF